MSSATNYGPVTLAGYARITTYSTGERGVLNGNIDGPHTLELWNNNGGYTLLNGTNTFANLNLTAGWNYFGHSGALGSGTIHFNNGGLSAYPAPLIVTNPVQPGAIAMHVGHDLGFLPITFANTITITNTHVDTYIHNTSTVIAAFTGGTKGIYKYAAGELRLAGTNVLGWIDCIQAGTVSYVSNSITTLSGNFNFRAGSTMNLFDNAQVEANQSFLGTGANGNWGTLNLYGGRLRLNNAGTDANESRVLTIGEYPNAASYVNLYGGELHATNGLARTFIGWSGSGYLRIHGGLALLKTIRARGQGGGIDLDGGELRVGTGGIDWTGGPQPVINLGGGTLGALADWSSTIPMSVNGTNGNTQVDGQGYTIALSGTMSGTGGLAKVGSGTLLLNGTWNAGAIAVDGGTLGGTGTLNAAVAVNAGGTIQPGNISADGVLVATTATFAAGSTLTPLLGGTGSLLRVTATNGLTVPAGADTVLVNISGLLPDSAGTYTVLDYEGTIQGGDGTNLVLSALPPRVVAYLTNNTVNTSIDLVVVTPAEMIKWVGNTDEKWDIDSPTNWMTTVGGVPTVYLQPGLLGDSVLFDDTAVGNFAITLQTNVAPGLVTVFNAANDYAIGGPFGIGGAALLGKAGAATLTLASSNSYSGGTFILGGTLQVGDGTNVGTLGTGAVTNDAVLAINQSQTNVFPNLVRGLGSLRKLGPGRVTLGQVNPYTGGTVIDGGELELIFANGGVGEMTINEGGTLRATVTDSINTFTNTTINRGGLLLQTGGAYQQFLNGPLVMNGGVLESTVAVAQFSNYGNFILRNSMTVGGTNTSIVRADFRMGDGATRTVTVGETGEDIDLFFQGYVAHFHGVTWGYMTKEGPGTVAFSNSTYTVQLGSLTVSAGEARFINALSTGSLGNGGLINNAQARVEITTGTTQTCNTAISGAGVLTKAGPGDLIISTAISGAQSVVVDGGVLLYPTAQAYGGGTTVSNGTLLVQSSSPAR
jgi:fibronectin-binding autotransporter adhesin